MLNEPVHLSYAAWSAEVAYERFFQRYKAGMGVPGHCKVLSQLLLLRQPQASGDKLHKRARWLSN